MDEKAEVGEAESSKDACRAGSSTLTLQGHIFFLLPQADSPIFPEKSPSRGGQSSGWGISFGRTLRSSEQRSVLGIWACMPPSKTLPSAPQHAGGNSHLQTKGISIPKDHSSSTRLLSHTAERGYCLGFQAIVSLLLRCWLVLRGFSNMKT